jgi:hypothetical protein
VVTFFPPGTVLEHPARTAAIAISPTSLRNGLRSLSVLPGPP